MKLKREKLIKMLVENIESKKTEFNFRMTSWIDDQRADLIEAVDRAKTDLAVAERDLAASKKKGWEPSRRYGAPQQANLTSLESLLTLVKASDDEEISVSPKIEKMLGL